MSIDTSTEAVARLHKRLGNVEVVEMQGDNLAVTLCSYFCNGEGYGNDNWWSDAALAGCAATIEAIQEHYAPTLRALAAERDALRDALRDIDGMVDKATRAPETADRWLDRIEETARAALAPKGGA